MITLERVGTLDVSAASGAVVHGGLVYVVADDGLALHGYALDGSPKSVLRLFDGTLPDEHAVRKKRKPDLEALALLPDGSMLAIGSGSTALRRRAAWVKGGVARPIDLSPLYEALGRTFDELNVEGLAVVGDTLVLAQRGNGKKRENALVHLDLGRAVAGLEAGTLDGDAIVRVDRVALGELSGVPLSFTDLACVSGALYFTAAAEDTDDPYLDAPCAGSVIGKLTEGGAVCLREALDPTCKIEGLAPLDGAGTFLLVADADDREVPAPLFRVRLPHSPS